jgi:hypothetical protein
VIVLSTTWMEKINDASQWVSGQKNLYTTCWHVRICILTWWWVRHTKLWAHNCACAGIWLYSCIKRHWEVLAFRLLPIILPSILEYYLLDSRGAVLWIKFTRSNLIFLKNQIRSVLIRTHPTATSTFYSLQHAHVFVSRKLTCGNPKWA